MNKDSERPAMSVTVADDVLTLTIDLRRFARIRAAHKATHAVDGLEAGAAWNELLQVIAHELSVE